jgi:hypothetical protein
MNTHLNKDAAQNTKRDIRYRILDTICFTICLFISPDFRRARYVSRYVSLFISFTIVRFDMFDMFV